jgi:hypothetical protein
VPEDEALLHRHAPVVDVKVRAADAAGLDPDDRLVGRRQLGRIDLVHPYLARRLKRDGSHRRESLVGHRVAVTTSEEV